MLGALVDRAAVGALAFEHAACVMQPVGQHADLGFRRRHKLAVEPDQVRTLVEWHRHGISSKSTNQGLTGLPQFAALPLLLRASSPDMLRPNHQSAPAGLVQRRRSNPSSRYDPFVKA